MDDFDTSPPWRNDIKIIKSVVVNNGVTHIGNYAFTSCSNLTDVIIPESVQTIGSYSFADCYNLTEIVLPDSVTSIWDSAFRNDFRLTEAKIPKNLKSLGDAAFSDCSNLKEIIIPSEITSIGRMTFANCAELTTVSIQKNIKVISDRAFYSCSKIKTVKYGGTQETWNEIKFAEGNDYLLNATFQYIPSVDFIYTKDSFYVTPTNVLNGNTIIFACYYDDKMVYVNSHVYAGETSIPFSTTETHDKVKIMIWKDSKSCVPLCEAEEIPIN